MGPPNVLSYFQRGHRRTPSDSNPSSPPPSQHSFEGPLQAAVSANLHPPRFPDDESLRSDSPVSPDPPILPPIPRVASRYESQSSVDVPSGARKDDTIEEHGEFASSKINSSKSTVDAGLFASQQRPTTTQRSSNITAAGALAKERLSALQIPPISQEGNAATSSRLPISPNPPKAQPPPPQKPSKTRLNLLNPMSLLMRRRSPQSLGYLSESGGNKNLTVPMMWDDFDPRIRGPGVHDFSAPRPRHNRSPNETPALGSTGPSVADGKKSPQLEEGEESSPEKQHTPVFTENFDQSFSVDSSGDIITGKDPLSHSPPPDPKILPPFARRLPYTEEDIEKGNHRKSQSSPVSAPITVDRSHQKEPSSTLDTVPEQSSEPPKRKALRENAKPRSRGPSLSNVSIASTNLPRHMTSNASRFSFDLAGVGSSAQEKLLEEKHREKALARKSATTDDSHDQDSMVDDDEAYIDDFDDDGGFEERIPGINADDDYDDGFEPFEEPIPGVNVDDDDDEDPTIRPANTGFDFQLQLNTALESPPSSANLSNGFAGTPRDASGKVIGFATSKESPVILNQQDPRAMQTPLTPDSFSHESQQIGGLGLIGLNEDSTRILSQSSTSATTTRTSAALSMQTPPNFGSDDDDLYFDDGIIEHPETTEETPFDESWFDNEADRLETNPARMEPRNLGQLLQINTHNISNSAMTTRMQLDAIPESEDSESASIRDHQTENQQPDYQSALAAAAMSAAAAGKFKRNGDSTFGSSMEFTHSGIAQNEREAGETTFSSSPPNSGGIEDYSYGIEDGLEDDPIIAEANAEALANDEDGFYGQEFGFFAHSNSSLNSDDLIAGGYFASSSDGLMRSQSGRVVCREPNLTPITERSEYSNRNSTTSLHVANRDTAAGSSPALTQLQALHAESSDDDINLSALLRLRRGAFGGSNSSLRSSSAAGGSPVASSPLAQQSAQNPTAHHSLSMSLLTANSSSNAPEQAVSRNSLGSISDSESSPASPTISAGGASGRASRAKWPIATTSTTTVLGTSDSSDSSPIKKGSPSPAEPWKKSHNRTGSGADSVSYVREEGEAGEERWVLEKRRMSAAGEMEVVERELVEGGKI